MKVKCPRCKKEVEYSAHNTFRPFCSKRCQDIDLGRWIEGQYALPGEPASPGHMEDNLSENKSPMCGKLQ